MSNDRLKVLEESVIQAIQASGDNKTRIKTVQTIFDMARTWNSGVSNEKVTKHYAYCQDCGSKKYGYYELPTCNECAMGGL